MKITEIRKKSKSELDKLLQELKKKVRVMRFDLASGTVKNVKNIGKMKRDIARILTILKEEK